MKKMEGPLLERIQRFLLQYRITPQTTTGQSPAELLMGRKLRTIFDLLLPELSKKIHDKQNKNYTTKRAIRSTNCSLRISLDPLPRWLLVVVTKVTGPLSYWVQTANGIIMKRHTDQLLSENITILDNS